MILNIITALLGFFIELFNAAYDSIAACKFKQAIIVFLFVFFSVLLLWGLYP